MTSITLFDSWLFKGVYVVDPLLARDLGPCGSGYEFIRDLPCRV